jgi:hypothetical protein
VARGRRQPWRVAARKAAAALVGGARGGAATPRVSESEKTLAVIAC